MYCKSLTKPKKSFNRLEVGRLTDVTFSPSPGIQSQGRQKIPQIKNAKIPHDLRFSTADKTPQI